MNYKGKYMVNRYEQVELFSRAEYRRRLDGIRCVMKEHEVDTALFLECGEEAYDHWLTGQRYLDLIIVPAADECIGVCMSELNEALCDDPGATDFGRYFLQKKPDMVCDGVRFIGHAPDSILADIIAAGSPKRIGLVLPVNMNASLYDGIKKRLPEVEFTDISIPVAKFRSVKSDEEMYAIMQSRNMQMKVMEALPQIFRLGRTIGEMQHEVSSLFMEMGSTGVRNGNIHYSGPMDEPGGPRDGSPDHKLQIGDRMSALFEVPGPGHQCIAFERHYSIGAPSKDYVASVNNAIDVHNFAVSLMKPDSLSLSQIADRTREYVHSKGLELFENRGWNWMHSLGAFFYDQFSLEDYTDKLPLIEGQMLHCHPLIYRYFPKIGPDVREGIHLVNTYRIGPDGAEDLIGIPKDLVVLFE